MGERGGGSERGEGHEMVDTDEELGRPRKGKEGDGRKEGERKLNKGKGNIQREPRKRRETMRL